MTNEDFNELIRKVSNSGTITQSQRDLIYNIGSNMKYNNIKNMKEINTRLLHDIVQTKITEHQQKFKTPIKIRVWENNNIMYMISNDRELLRMVLKSINEDTNIPYHNSDATEIKSKYVNKMYEASVGLYKLSSSLKGFDFEYVHPKEHLLKYSDLHFGMMSVSSLINYCIGKLEALTNNKTLIEVRYCNITNSIIIFSNNASLIDDILTLVLSNIYGINIVGYSKSNDRLILNFDKDDQEYKEFRSFICAYNI